MTDFIVGTFWILGSLSLSAGVIDALAMWVMV